MEDNNKSGNDKNQGAESMARIVKILLWAIGIAVFLVGLVCLLKLDMFTLGISLMVAGTVSMSVATPVSNGIANGGEKK